MNTGPQHHNLQLLMCKINDSGVKVKSQILMSFEINMPSLINPY